mmetsp:Transcript_58000/g.169564  ORF Transcript_58000/g.169564 Transcript_58000/m.169564 type:complete len:834 (+) Transcript_58000:84-2585(+)
MLWQKAKDQVSVENLSGPKTLRSNLVGDGGSRKVDLDDLDLDTCELIGQGAYGMVHKVQERTTGQSRVMKTVVRPEGWDDNKLKMEAELLRNLDHPHILRIFSWYEDGDAINIVMEHCEGGELLKVVRAGRRQGYDVSEIWLATAIRQTFEALVYLHSKSVVHKDLKGQNILLLRTTDDNDGSIFEALPHIVVCDLGIAEVCCRGIFGMRGSKVAGTPTTMAPEVWMGSCGPKSDVWSMGCVTFELFSSRPPFRVSGVALNFEEKWLELHRKGPDWKLMACSQNALNLCKQLLTFKEASRPTASESLRHPWFKLCEEIRLTEKEVSALCKAMLSWRQRNPMQRALCLKMAVGCTCINKFASIFTKFDKDHSGILDKGEVMSALQQLGMDRSTAKKAASALDVNGDNSCEYLEFVAACLSSLEEKFDELLRQEFRTFDRFGRGELRPQDLDPLLEELKPLAASRGLQLAEIDTNNDGVISFTEFCTYFGRKGVKYAFGTRASNDPHNSAASLPMKEHIRIMNSTTDSVQDSMERIQDSMERIRTSMSMERTAAPTRTQEEASEIKKPKPTRTKGSLTRAASEEAVGIKKPKPAQAKGSPKGVENDVAVCKQPSEGKKKPARVRRKASQGRLPKEATRRKQVSEGSGKSEERRKQAGAGRPGAEALQPQFSEASTRASAADGEAPRREAARAGGEAPEDQKERPAEQEPEGAGGGAAEGAEEEEEAPQEDAVVINKDDWSMDLAIDLPPQLPHPCSFQLSSDNLHLITTSFIQSPVTSFEKMDAAYCTGCSPLAAFARLQFHLGDHGKHGLQGSADAVDAYDGEQLPTGHCIVSL